MSDTKLSRVTGGEISKIFEKLKEDGLIFRCSFSQLSKHLLKEFLSVNPFAVDFPTLKQAYLENIEFDATKVINEDETEFNKTFRKKHNDDILNAIKDEVSFHKYICKYYFDLVTEPKEELLNEFLIARNNIIEIDNTLADIKKESDEIYKRNQADEIQEKKPILLYYEAHNQRAKEDILNFIKVEIKDYALNKSYDNSLFSSFLSNSYNYNYSFNPKAYKPKPPNDLENKFGELPYSEFLDLCKLYKNNKSEFYSYLSNYITEQQITFSINDLLQYHHVLAVRKEIIIEAINIYEHGSKIMFANAVPSIIEGILHDLCLLIGESENDLLKEGFQYKLDKLHEVLGWELYYEYYSFRFRIFRNKVSHGRLEKSDVDELADLLLLDLYQMCKLVKSHKIKLNQKLFVIHELSHLVTNTNFKYLMEYLTLGNVEIPLFYKLESQIEKIEKLIEKKDFWTFLETELDKKDEEASHGIHYILKMISSRDSLKDKCKKLFKKTRIKTVNKDLANNYLKYLTRDY